MDSKLSANQKFVIAILLIGICVVGTAVYTSGLWAVFLSAFICVLIYLLRPLVMPAGYGANKIRTLCVVGSLGLAASWGAWSDIVNAFLCALAADTRFAGAPEWVKAIRLGGPPSAYVLAFVLGVVFIINFFMRDKSISGGHPTPLEADFPEETFERKLEAFCAALTQDLTTIDRMSNWSPEYYTELQAEVEILSANGAAARKKIANLQDAIRNDRVSPAFLILGVPGSGKSVALRKLAKDMLWQVGTTGRVPIYVNLREWIPPQTHDGSRVRFGLNDLEDFVVDNVKKRGDVFTEDFVDKYFRKMWQHGRLFFIFDSFDEIAELLDADEDSDVINSLSNVISRFISTHPASRGVLSSRVFRRPNESFLAQKVLEIRPLSEASISEALSRYPQFTDTLRLTLFRERSDLIPLARNPFIMALLGHWVKNHHALPDNQAQVYQGYIQKQLESCTSRLKALDLTAEEVIDTATEIAWFVFESSSFGLEAPVKVISEHFNSLKVDATLELLSYARIARVTHGDDKSFAFVHRRFLEYFVTIRLLAIPTQVPASDIPTDSRGRDALVLYAQLCDEDEAQRLANLCWREIQDNLDQPKHLLRAIHCLRFLVDAFSSRRQIILPFEKELSEFVTRHAGQGDSLILAKICLEATGLLSEAKAAPILSAAIVSNDSWLQETAFRACRHLPRMGKELEQSISSYVLAIPDISFWSNSKNILLSLSLSDALRGVSKTSRIRLANLKVSALALVIAMLLSPLVLGVSALYSVMGVLFFGSLKKPGVTSAKLKKAQNPSAPAQTRGIIERGFFNAWIFSFRFVSALMLILMGVIELGTASVKYFSTTLCLLAPCDRYSLEIALVHIVLGAALFDWVAILRALRDLAKDWTLSSIMKTLLAIAVAMLVVGAMSYAVILVSQYQVAKTAIQTIVVLAGIGLSIRVAGTHILRGIKCVKDLRLLKQHTLAPRMTRTDIANLFLKLSSVYGRLRLVRKMQAERVTAIGDWPVDFKLAVGSGEAMSALARLEERWLKLDR